MEDIIDFSRLPVMGEGVTAVTYLLSETRVIKAYKKGVPLEMIESERKISETLCRYGIRTPVCYETVRTAEGYGNVYQAMRGGTLTKRMLQADEEGLRAWMQQYAGLAKELHGVRAEHDINDCLEIYRFHLKLTRDLLTDEVISLAERTLSGIPGASNLLHGDMSPGNIMLDEGQLYFIDLATVTKGHPALDLTVPYMVTLMWPRFAAMAKAMTEDERAAQPAWFGYLNRYTEKALSEEAGRMAWVSFLKEYFCLASNEEALVWEITKLIRYIAMVKYCLCGSFQAIYPDELVHKMAEFYSGQLLSCEEPDLELLKDDRWNLQKAE
ncbi:MAG: phosphotransferase [Clostridia bacterium]|nr:phosphotransferase [Clostridia bacterium]